MPDQAEESLPTSIWDPKANVNRKQADAFIKRIRSAAEANGVLTLKGLELWQLASMLVEMDRHLPDFFEKGEEDETHG
jgi:hypothetical protein